MSIAKRDVLELRRRMTKKSCTIDWLCGCYVDGGKNVVLKFSASRICPRRNTINIWKSRKRPCPAP